MSKEVTLRETALDKLGISSATIASIPQILDLVFSMEKKITVCLIGDTGIGKTPVIHQWAEARGGYVHVMHFGHMTPEDISMTMFNESATEFGFVPHAALVKLNREAEARGCAVLFIDEVNRGDKTLLNGFFTLPDDREIQGFKLHPNVIVVAAMNPSDGSYMVNQAERDPAIRKRLCMVYATTDLASWLRFAREAKFHKLVVDFVAAMGQYFYDYAARDAGKAFACPSSWEKVSQILTAAEANKTPLTSSLVSTLVKGQIGSTAGHAFLEFVRDQSTVIQPADILEDYEKGGRARVAKLLGKEVRGGKLVSNLAGTPVRTDIITTLNRSLALHLTSMMPDPEEAGPNLAKYLLDLPNELFQAFWAEHMKGETTNSAQAKAYIASLNAVLKGLSGYNQRIKELFESQRNMHKELNAG